MSAPLTPAGEAAVADLAQRYRVSDGAVRNLLDAVIRGGGAMAQFSHPDLGGNGQWMRGGMTMVGDMFNSGLQSTVSGICSELSSQLASGVVLVTVPDRAAAGAAFGSFGGDWWPAELGRPSSSGGQNDAAYAYFPGPRRLAIRRGGAITLYDTGDHSISGVQQQQGGRGSLEFSSQLGSFTVDSLPVVDAGAATAGEPSAPPIAQPAAAVEQPAAAVEPPVVPSAAAQRLPGQAQAQSQSSAAVPPLPVASHQLPPHPPVASHPADLTAPASPPSAAAPPPVSGAPVGAATTPAEIGAAIETLAGLRDKGFLTDDEFTAKKTELLARL